MSLLFKTRSDDYKAITSSEKTVNNIRGVSGEQKDSWTSRAQSLFHFFATPFVALYHLPQFLYSAPTIFCNFNKHSSDPIKSEVTSASSAAPQQSAEAQECLKKIIPAYENLKTDLQSIEEKQPDNVSVQERAQQRQKNLEGAYEIFFDAVASCQNMVKQTLSEHAKEEFKNLKIVITNELEPTIGDLVASLKKESGLMDDWKRKNPNCDEQQFFSDMRSYARELCRECELHLT